MAFLNEPKYPQPQLRAKGNLSYLQFIRLVERWWLDGHPDIPIIPAGLDTPAKYPCIVYGLEVRKVHESDPKPRLREYIDEQAEAIRTTGQRFQNVVSFTAYNESGLNNAHVVEQLIEVFEDFMLEHIPAFKEMGLSEIVYARRLPDHEENRQGAGIVRRAVSFMVTTEKVHSVSVEKLRRAVVSGRVFFRQMPAHFEVVDGASGKIRLHSAVLQTGDVVSVQHLNTQSGDRLDLPTGLYEGQRLQVLKLDDDIYELLTIPANDSIPPEAITGIGEGRGTFLLLGQDVTIDIVDEHNQNPQY